MVMCFLLDVFGRAASVPSVHCSIWPFGRRSTQQVQTNRVKCDVVNSKPRFNCVSTRPKRLGRCSGYRRHDNALLGLRGMRKSDPLLPDGGMSKKQSRLREV
jgi:hypothetical protein